MSRPFSLLVRLKNMFWCVCMLIRACTQCKLNPQWLCVCVFFFSFWKSSLIFFWYSCIEDSVWGFNVKSLFFVLCLCRAWEKSVYNAIENGFVSFKECDGKMHKGWKSRERCYLFIYLLIYINTKGECGQYHMITIAKCDDVSTNWRRSIYFFCFLLWLLSSNYYLLITHYPTLLYHQLSVVSLYTKHPQCLLLAVSTRYVHKLVPCLFNDPLCDKIMGEGRSNPCFSSRRQIGPLSTLITG